MKKMAVLMVVVLIASFALGCAAHIHTVGAGPQQSGDETARQWYILWGLVPINDVDSKAMAGGASDYEIKTEISPIDFLIGIPASLVTIQSRTVTVTK